MCIEHGISIEQPDAAGQGYLTVSDRAGTPGVAANAESGNPVRAERAAKGVRTSNALGSME